MNPVLALVAPAQDAACHVAQQRGRRASRLGPVSDPTVEIPSRLKVCVIGGASTYTPELVEGFAARWPALPVEELTLFDIDADRLAVVGGLSERILAERGWPGRLVLTTDRTEALTDADFVVCQLRVGGQQARFVDETLPHEFGCIGQETTGAGGFAKALRTVPVVLELARELERIGAPDAWFVNFTNPVGIVTQALLDAGHRAIGLCNVAIGLQRRIAAALDVAPDRVELEHVGLNHLTWERAVRVDGTDRLGDLLDVDGERWAEHLELPLDADAHAADLAVVLPALLLPARRGAGRAAARPVAGRAGDGDRADVARDVPRPDAAAQAGAARRARRRVLQRGRGAADRLAARRHRRRAGGRHPQRRHAGRAGRRRRRRGAGP